MFKLMSLYLHFTGDEILFYYDCYKYFNIHYCIYYYYSYNRLIVNFYYIIEFYNKIKALHLQ